MIVCSKSIRAAWSGCLLLLCAAATAADAGQPASPTEAELDELDKQFWQFTAGFYPHHARATRLAVYKSPQELDAAITAHITNKEPTQAVAVITANLPLIKKHIENPKVIDYITLLLDQNDWQTASTLFTLIKEEASKTLVANVAYLFAGYYFERNKWPQVLEQLNGIIADLPQDRSHHALLMQGIALQRLKKHREAIKLYEKIPATSKYYVTARLNMAVANIRQDWWTDAHTIINNLLKHPVLAQQEETIDRLYTTLGYSFLQQQYYRNSRDAFRNVGQNGSYANQALLGIALTAANQDDYIGALNAVRLLKEKTVPDLPVDESYLLMPYFYEKLKQHTTASAGYDEAVQYYTNRINALSAAMQADVTSFRKLLSFDNKQRLHYQNQIIDIQNFAPRAFIHNYQLLSQYRPYLDKLADKKVEQEFARLDSSYAGALHKYMRVALDERINQLTHYMNQSRYGIARLIDKPEAATP